MVNKFYVADFETTSSKYYEKFGYTKVWLWAICDNNAVIVARGYDIESFMQYCYDNLGNQDIYFHNLKFDGSFILDYCLKQGLQYLPKLKDNKSGVACLISDMGAWYSIDVKYNNRKCIHFKDSLKLLPFTVKKIAEDFKLPILKEHIDYEDYSITDEKIEYIDHDVRIVAMALNIVMNEGLTRLTTASSAFSNYKKTISKQFFELNFPIIENTELLRAWRDAYRGGRSQVNPIYKDKVLHNVRRYDINSMYPYIMRSMPLPYGKPHLYYGRDKYVFELHKVRIGFILKEGHLPSLLKKDFIFGEDSYYIQTEDIEEIWLSNIDLKLVERNYDVYHLEILETYGFATSTKLFNDYIDYWYDKKQHDTGAQRIVDKLMLNSLYGKFGTNIDKQHKIPSIDDESYSVKFDNSEVEEGKQYYLPVAIAIVSWAHWLIDNAIHETGVDNFVYCDTDSVHTLGELPPSMVDNAELGKFKLEAIEDICKYVRQKTYITNEYNNKKNINEWHITCCGMPDKCKDRLIKVFKDDVIDEFKVGLTVNGKLMPKRVNGGTILYETQFEIR